MTLSSDFVLWELLAFEGQVREFRRHARTLAETFGTGHVALAIEAMAGVRQAFDRLAATLCRLRAHVVTFDGPLMGSAMESTGELWLRATTMVMVEQLIHLNHVFRAEACQGHTTAATSSQALFVGKFRTFGELAGYVLTAIAQIQGTWMRYSSRHSATAEPNNERRFLYRRAVADAQRALATLGEDPDVAHFLRAGREGTGSPALRTACNQILAVLRIRLDVELDPALLQGPLAATAPLAASSRGRR